MNTLDVLILMGSDSDADIMRAAGDALNEFGLKWEMTVASAHRSPARVMRLIDDGHQRGVKVFIIGAGAAAHLAGVVAAHTTRPVIGVQMPPGVPVATVAIGKPGATNAGVLAAQMIALGDRALAGKLTAYKKKLEEKVEAAAAKLKG